MRDLLKTNCLYLSNLKRIIERRNIMLKDLCFEVIQTCPNKCKFCSSNSSKEKKTIITLETFKRVVNYFINHGRIEEISISGGEPFLHPDLWTHAF